MSNPLNDPATQLEIMANRTLITSIGKALVKKGVISHSEIASELSSFIHALEQSPSGADPLLVAELKHILGAVVTW